VQPSASSENGTAEELLAKTCGQSLGSGFLYDFFATVLAGISVLSTKAASWTVRVEDTHWAISTNQRGCGGALFKTWGNQVQVGSVTDSNGVELPCQTPGFCYCFLRHSSRANCPSTGLTRPRKRRPTFSMTFTCESWFESGRTGGIDFFESLSRFASGCLLLKPTASRPRRTYPQPG